MGVAGAGCCGAIRGADVVISGRIGVDMGMMGCWRVVGSAVADVFDA
jgi:hypothetical protein